MYTIEIEKECECGCHQRNGFLTNYEFENREDAYMKAKVLECRLNQESCFKYFYQAVDYNEKIKITMELRPEDDEEYDEDLDIQKLLKKNPIQLGFNKEEEPPGKSGGEHN